MNQEEKLKSLMARYGRKSDLAKAGSGGPGPGAPALADRAGGNSWEEAVRKTVWERLNVCWDI